MSGPVDKDPVTGEPYTVDTPRVIAASVSDNGKFIWPQVVTADGNKVKLLYHIWTEQEKQIYKDKRKADKIKQLEHEVKPEAKTITVRESTIINRPVTRAKPIADDYCYWTAASATTQNIIKKCNAYAGTWNCGGLVYAMLTVRGSNTVYHVPKSVIAPDDLNRLCSGNSCN